MLNSNRARVVLLALLVGALVLFFVLGGAERLSLESLKQDRDALLAFVEAQPLLAALGFGLAYILAVALSVPGAAVLTLAAGALFGLVVGVLLASLASTIGATLAMLAARFVARDWVRERFPAAVERIDRGIARDGDFYLLSLRLAPVFPFFLINLAMGLTAMPPLRYALVTMIGAFPGTIAYTWAGTALARVDSLSSILTPELIGAFLALALLPLFGKWAARKLLGRKARRKFRRPDRFDADLIAIGAGSGGLVASLVGTQLNARVILIERARMGGDCLNTGCVPSKSLIRAARAADEMRHATRFGVTGSNPPVDFTAVMRRIQQAIAEIAPNDSVERYEGMGVDVRKASARLVDPWTVELEDGERLRGRFIVIATGASPRLPDLPGLNEIDYVTSETLWDALAQRDSVPGRFVVVGGGPIGCELGQALARLGSNVTIVGSKDRLLHREDAEASRTVEQALAADGVRLLTGRRADEVEEGRLRLDNGETVDFDLLMVAVGRQPRLAGLGLEELGIDCEQPLERQAREPWPHILFVGDAAGGEQFTHFAGHSGAIAAINAVGSPFVRFGTDDLVPRVTFTSPEVASVGLTEAQAAEKGRKVEIVRYDLRELDRAVVDDAGDGFVKLVLAKGSDRVLGATIVGPHAGDLILPWILAIRQKIGLKAMLSAMHPYPTYSEAGRAAAGAWRRAHRPEWALRLLGRWLEWRRG